MSDRYSQLVKLPVAGTVAKRIGLPQPVTLERGRRVLGRVLLGGAGRVAGAAARVLAEHGRRLGDRARRPGARARGRAGLDAAVFNPQAPADRRFKALVFDATGITSSAELVELQRFFYPTVRRVAPSGRVIVLGGGGAHLEGFTRSLGKEIGRGATVNLVHVDEGAEAHRPDAALPALAALGLRERAGGARRAGRRRAAGGPQRARHRRLARHRGGDRGGARARRRAVTRLDLATRHRARHHGRDAPPILAERFADGLDVLVHNAGITKDRTLAKMPEERWQSLMEVNLLAPERITAALLPHATTAGSSACPR